MGLRRNIVFVRTNPLAQVVIAAYGATESFSRRNHMIVTNVILTMEDVSNTAKIRRDRMSANAT